MKITILEMMLMIAVIGMIASFALAWRGRQNPKTQWPRWRRGRERIALANDPQDGVHLGGRITRRADGAIGRNLLCKAGSDANHIALAGAADVALAVTLDEGEAAEDLVNVQLLACADRTVRMQTDGGGAIVYGDLLVPSTNGQVKKIPAGAGNYYVVGFARTAPVTAAGELLEVEPYGGYQTH